MKPIITRDQVSTAIDSLKATGKKPTLVAIHAALGNKGSLSTLVKIKAEIDAEQVRQHDSEEGLKAFREVWAAAVEEGRKQKESECDELRQALEGLASENQSLSGQQAAISERLAVTEQQRDQLLSELRTASEQITAARAAGEQHASRLADALTKLGEVQTVHTTEIGALRQQISDGKDENHRLALALARAEAKLEHAKL